MNDIELLECATEKNPKGALARIAQVIGPGPAALLMKQMAGQILYMPSRRTLFLLSLPLIIEEQTAGLVGKEKKAMMKNLSKILGLPVWKIKKRMQRS